MESRNRVVAVQQISSPTGCTSGCNVRITHGHPGAFLRIISRVAGEFSEANEDCCCELAYA